MKLVHFSCIDSTNTYLKEHFNELEDMTFVSADEQTAGRGRNNRVWKSENGRNLLFSLLLINEEFFSLHKELPILSAYSVLEVLRDDYGLNSVSIKWPNDVYVGDKKICGILLEAVSTDKLECLIIGIGLNVNQKVFNNDVLHEPTSLSLELHKDIDINTIKEKIYQKITANLTKVLMGHNFYKEISEVNYLLNKEVYALINDEKKLIKVLGLNNDYSLIAEVDGKVTTLFVGEISFHV